MPSEEADVEQQQLVPLLRVVVDKQHQLPPMSRGVQLMAAFLTMHAAYAPPQLAAGFPICWTRTRQKLADYRLPYTFAHYTELKKYVDADWTGISPEIHDVVVAFWAWIDSSHERIEVEPLFP